MSSRRRDTEHLDRAGRRRLLPGVLSLRDVEDVEEHAAGHLEGVPLSETERRAEILRAIGDAYRVDRALPPERPLLPLLDALLTSRAARLACERSRPLSQVA
jgi:hypothetical protein